MNIDQLISEIESTYCKRMQPPAYNVYQLAVVTSSEISDCVGLRMLGSEVGPSGSIIRPIATAVVTLAEVESLGLKKVMDEKLKHMEQQFFEKRLDAEAGASMCNYLRGIA